MTTETEKENVKNDANSKANVGKKPLSLDELRRRHAKLGGLIAKREGKEKSEKREKGFLAWLFGPLVILFALMVNGCAVTEIDLGKPLTYRLSIDPPGVTHQFSEAASVTWGEFDGVRTIRDVIIIDEDLTLGQDCQWVPRGVVYTDGTGDWSNGITGSVESVFVGPWRRTGGECGDTATAIFTRNK